jgi:hypothetical protein
LLSYLCCSTCTVCFVSMLFILYCLLFHRCCSTCTVCCCIFVVLPLLFVVVSLLFYLYCLLLYLCCSS